MQLVEKVHSHMKELLGKEDAEIDGIFFCPHYRTGIVSEYTADCDCRKPRTGLIKKACGAFDIDMTHSYVIGDRCTDIEMAQRADLEGILVKTGYGLGDIEYVLPGSPFKPIHVASDLLDAVRWIIERDDRY